MSDTEEKTNVAARMQRIAYAQYEKDVALFGHWYTRLCANEADGPEPEFVDVRPVQKRRIELRRREAAP